MSVHESIEIYENISREGIGLTWEYHSLEYVHVYGETQTVGPAKPTPPLDKESALLRISFND
jgi:hypothetical protein